MISQNNLQSKQEFVNNIVHEIFDLYQRLGNEEYGERVTMLMHMIQAASWAEKENASNELIVAAFLHDIGHFFEKEEKMGEFGSLAHDQLGKDYLLGLGFPEQMGNWVASHVAAKRYLTAVEPQYLGELSEASKQTLIYQGGPMTPDEVIQFESDPYWKQYVQLRRWDDLGKDANLKVLPQDISHMKSLMVEYLMENYKNGYS